MLGFACFSGAAAQTHPPVEAFGRLPVMRAPKLSPDGKYFATIQALKGRPAVVIYPVGPDAGKPSVVPSTDWLVEDIAWAKPDRLVIVAKQSTRAGWDDRIRTWVRAVAVDPHGENPAVFFKDRQSLGVNLNGAAMVDIDLDDPVKVFVPLWAMGAMEQFRLDLFKVDTHTGASERAVFGGPRTAEWYMDGHGKVVARVDQTEDPLVDHLKIYNDGDWTEVRSFDATGDNGAGIMGLKEDGSAFVTFNVDPAGRRVLATLDKTTGADGAVLFADPVYDITGALADEWTGRVIGASYIADKEEYRYFDPARQALQRGLEKSFPGMSVFAASLNTAQDRAVVAVEGPRRPTSYFYLNRTTHQADPIGDTYPDLMEADLGEMKPYPYKARDGLPIPAYITLPPGKAMKNLPVVVMPHGGPDSRDGIGFDWWAQFLANRGYLVFQPNFRGSKGYGYGFTQAGLRQWGLKMQDDITDGVKQLIADGIADPKRVCIVGASYGGYAALAGATFTPDLYACAVSFAGISDLPLMLRTEKDDHGKESGIVSFWRSRIGHPSDDSDQLRATSPARHADQVKCPVLLLHGEGDTTVRIEQSKVEYDALRSAGKNVEFIRFKGEDHYMALADTRIRLLTELEKFLAANIGN